MRQKMCTGPGTFSPYTPYRKGKPGRAVEVVERGGLSSKQSSKAALETAEWLERAAKRWRAKAAKLKAEGK